MTHRIKNLLVLGLILVGGLLIYTNMSPDSSTSTQDNYSFNANPKVVMHTNLGDVTLELFRDKAPKTVDNFVKLSRQGFYDGTLFHRVIKGFMIQGGDPNTKTDPKNWQIHGTGGPGYQFADEINDQPLVRGILAMANAGPNTNGSQFFIITAPATDWLNGKHTPFGKVIAGMEVVDKIEQVKVNEVAHPLEDVVVEKVEVK
jgi:cyclophilin family peptidyl-prolyl cis-trans isomerase